ncbi:MAG TPA: recombination-associated protein RdgC [Verrucomicrobiae bacterium]|nr:recombination-associated protein RdgC [Verrucomicrobiae bacterium]
MGIFSNTVSVCQFRVIGEVPQRDLFGWGSEKLAKQAFQPIDGGTQESSTGWVHVDDPREFTFDAPLAFQRDHYLTFSIRTDTRKVPGALLKGEYELAEREFLAANPGFRRVPKQKREEIRERVKESLLARTLPVPATSDAVWDTRSGIVTFTSLGSKNVDLFDGLFRKTFEGFRLIPVHPFARGELVLEEALLPRLAAENKASGDSVLHSIRDNRWIGWDFFTWLMYLTMNGRSEYAVSRPGPAADGEPFSAYLDDRLVLLAQGENGTQKVTVAGPQDRFEEVRTALRAGKVIQEATLHLEQDENHWKTTLKGEMFHFASFRCPSVRIEKDAGVDEASEREAVFFERMAVLERGFQLFDSLYRGFLAERLGEEWPRRMEAIREWIG